MEEHQQPEDSLYHKVTSHPFMLEVIQNYSPVQHVVVDAFKSEMNDLETFDVTKQRVLEEISSTNQNLFNIFQYHSEVFLYSTNLAKGIERLEMAPIFIRRFSRTKTYDKYGITRHKWIKYHYSNYLITVTSVCDTALLLTNAVFLLNIKPQKLSIRKVANHDSVKETPVKAALEQLDNLIHEYRYPRNLFAHRNITPDLPMLDEWERHRFIHEAQQDLNIVSEPIYPPQIVKRLSQRERRELIHKLQEKNFRVADVIVNFLTMLKPFYSIYNELLNNRS